MSGLAKLPLDVFNLIAERCHDMFELHEAVSRLFTSEDEYRHLTNGRQFVPTHTDYFERLSRDGFRFDRDVWASAYLNPSTREVARAMLRHRLVCPCVADYLVIDPSEPDDYHLLHELSPTELRDSFVNHSLPIGQPFVNDVYNDTLERIHHYLTTDETERPRLDYFYGGLMLTDALLGRTFWYTSRLRDPYDLLSLVTQHRGEAYLDCIIRLGQSCYYLGQSLVPPDWVATLATLDGVARSLFNVFYNGRLSWRADNLIEYISLRSPSVFPSDFAVWYLKKQRYQFNFLNHRDPVVVQAAIDLSPSINEAPQLMPESVESLMVLYRYFDREITRLIAISGLIESAVDQTRYYLETRGGDLWFTVSDLPPELTLCHVVSKVLDLAASASPFTEWLHPTDFLGLPLVLFRRVLDSNLFLFDRETYDPNKYLVVRRWTPAASRLMRHEYAVPHNQLTELLTRGYLRADRTQSSSSSSRASPDSYS